MVCQHFLGLCVSNNFESYLHLISHPLPIRVVVVTIDWVFINLLQILWTSAAGAGADLPAHEDDASDCDENQKRDHSNKDVPSD